MKNKLIGILAALLLLAGCLDDENKYDYIRINSGDGYKVKNFETFYTCFQGEELVLAPEFKFTIDSIAPDASYEWYVDKELKSTEPTYRFRSDKPGNVEVVFTTIDNKTGVRFSEKTTVSVVSKYFKGWVILSSPVGSDRSQLNVVMVRTEKHTRIKEGKEVQYDTIVYIGEERDIYPGLGTGPLKLTENFTYDENGLLPEQVGDEIVVIQRDKCVELNGNTLEVMAYAQDEFLGNAPAGFQPIDAAGNYACKYVLNKDGYIYFAHNTIGSDLHTARYLPDAAFGGRKVKALTPTHKIPYAQSFSLVLDENNTYFGITNDVGVKKDYSLTDTENVGGIAEIDAGSFDRSHFCNIPGEVLFTDVSDYSRDEARYLSFVKQDGKYYAHVFGLYMYRKPPLEVQYDKWTEMDPAMFTNWKDAAVFHFNDFVLVANGNELWHYSFREDGDRGKCIKTFDKPIVSLFAKDFNLRYDFAGISHAGIALEGGEFYVYQLSYPDAEDVSRVEMHKLYHQTGFGDIKDVLYKHGRSYYMYYD